MLIPII